MSKPPRMKYIVVARRLRKHGAYFVREGSNHEIWRCACGEHQGAVPRHGDVSSYVIDKIGQKMKCLGEEWWK